MTADIFEDTPEVDDENSEGLFYHSENEVEEAASELNPKIPSVEEDEPEDSSLLDDFIETSDDAPEEESLEEEEAEDQLDMIANLLVFVVDEIEIVQGRQNELKEMMTKIMEEISTLKLDLFGEDTEEPVVEAKKSRPRSKTGQAGRPAKRPPKIKVPKRKISARAARPTRSVKVVSKKKARHSKR